MGAAGDDDYLIARYPIDQAVFIGDVPAPVSGKFVLQRPGFPYSIVSVAVYVVDELVDPFEDLPVCSLPAAIVVPRCVSPGLEHGYRPHRGVREG